MSRTSPESLLWRLGATALVAFAILLSITSLVGVTESSEETSVSIHQSQHAQPVGEVAGS